MNRKQINQKLKDHSLSSHEREVLLQTLHYLQAEGLDSTSGNSNSKRSKSSNYTSKKRSSSSKNHSKRNSSSS